MAIRRSVVLALALLPWPCALHLPRWIVGKSLEQDVNATLPLAIGTIAFVSLLLNTALVTKPDTRSCFSSLIATLLRGLLGLLVGTVFFHTVIVLFGAPFQLLFMRTALLALLLASSTFAPLAMHVGVAWNDAVDVVLNLRARTDVEVHVASVAIGAMLGAWLGAIPIPLDWDRPWQQWPLTCVYGVLGGVTLGHLTAVAVVEWMKKRKTE